jgi:hypothetical protein
MRRVLSKGLFSILRIGLNVLMIIFHIEKRIIN